MGGLWGLLDEATGEVIMKSKWLIEQRLEHEEDPVAIQTLQWILESPECPLCNHGQRKDLEYLIASGVQSPSYLEEKHNWVSGIIVEHMEEHIEYAPEEAMRIEKLRDESITTLDMAEDVFSRIQSWLDEWEEMKAETGITREWIGEATKLVSAANTNLKLIGTLKKEIGVDSQLLLAQQQVNGVMGILVDVLREEPALLNQMELRLAALKAPIVDVEFEVIE